MLHWRVWWACTVACLHSSAQDQSLYHHENQRMYEHETVAAKDIEAPSTTCPTTTGPRSAKNMCHSRLLLSHIQRLQLSRARSEVGMNGVRPNTSNHMGFYTYSFGETELLIGSQQIVYHRIYKNGNDMIRNILKSVSLTLRMPLRNVAPTLNINMCDKSHHKGDTRIPFTFFRDPLSRFISAYSEYEVRLESMCLLKDGDRQHSSCHRVHDKINDVYLTSAVGTVGRVKDVIRMLLYYDGSSSQMVRELGFCVSHFFAQVSVLFTANASEVRPLQQYRLENFQEEWDRFANTTPAPHHLTGSLQRGISQPSNAQSWHVSQSDLRPTKAAAKELLLTRNPTADDGSDVSGSDAGSRGQGVRSEGSEDSEESEGDRKVYVRAVCRLYLSDYVCLDYPLPADCLDLYDELVLDQQQYDASSAARARADNYHASSRNGDVHSDSDTIAAAASWSSLLSWVVPLWGVPSPCGMFPPPGMLHWLLSVLMRVPCWWHADHQECVLGKMYGFPVRTH